MENVVCFASPVPAQKSDTISDILSFFAMPGRTQLYSGVRDAPAIYPEVMFTPDASTRRRVAPDARVSFPRPTGLFLFAAGVRQRYFRNHSRTSSYISFRVLADAVVGAREQLRASSARGPALRCLLSSHNSAFCLPYHGSAGWAGAQCGRRLSCQTDWLATVIRVLTLWSATAAAMTTAPPNDQPIKPILSI